MNTPAQMSFHLRRNLLPILGTVVLAAAPALADPSRDDLIDGVIARSAAIYQGQFAFEVTEQQGPSPAEMQVTRADQYELTVTGNDWLLRSGNSPNRLMNRGSSTIRYYETKSSEGILQHALHIDAPLSIDDARGKNVAYTAPRLGTFWYPEQTIFVDTHRTQATRLDGQTIAGAKTWVLQWQVKGADFDQAFLVIPPSIAEQRGGLLRIFIAPELGYALPRIEYCTPEGNAAKRYEATDFFEVEEGVYLPRRSECTTRLAKQISVTKVDIQDIRYINESIPAEVFDFAIPAGTRVRDSRPGHPKAVFRLESALDFRQWEATLRPAAPESTWSTRRLAWLVINGLILSGLLLLWWRRRKQARLAGIFLTIGLLAGLPSSGRAAPTRVEYSLDDVFLRIKQHRELVRMCGPLSAIRALSLLGHCLDPSPILHRYTQDATDGVRIQQVVNLCRQYEKDSRAVSIADRNFDRVTTPCLLLVNGGRHCVVLESVAKHSPTAEIWDPSDLHQKSISQERLRAMWSGQAIVLRPSTWSPWAVGLLTVGCTILAAVAISHFVASTGRMAA